MAVITDFITEDSEHDRFVYLNGEIDGLLYHTVFLPQAEGYKSFVLLENGEAIEIQKEKPMGSYFLYGNKRHRFFNGPEVEYCPGVVNYPSPKAYAKVERREIPDKHQLYARLTSILEDYYQFYQPEERRIVATHIIHSYLIGAIGTTFYLLLEGELNTGKSSLQKIMSELQYHGCFSGQTTVPAMVRKIHTAQATVNIDELDKLSSEDKGKALGVLNSGFYSGGTYEITNMNAKNIKDQIQVIQTFCAKTFSANKIRLDSSLQSRCVTINTVRSSKRTRNANRISDEDKKRISEVRDDLFTYGLLKGRDILQQIEIKKTELANEDIFARTADVTSIILGIEAEFGQDEAVKLYLLENKQIEEDESKETDRVHHMFEFLLEKCKNAGRNMAWIEFTNSEVVEYINDKLGLSSGPSLPFDKPDKYAATSASVGKSLKLHKIISKANEYSRITSGPTRGRMEYRIARSKLHDLLKRCSYKDIIKGLEELEEYLILGNSTNEEALPF